MGCSRSLKMAPFDRPYTTFYWSASSLLFSSGQTAVKLSGAEAADRAQCAAPDKPIGYWNLLVAFANLKRVIQCACFKSLGSRKGTPKCNLRILIVARHLRRKWRLVSSSSLQRGHNGSLTLRIMVRSVEVHGRNDDDENATESISMAEQSYKKDIDRVHKGL